MAASRPWASLSIEVLPTARKISSALGEAAVVEDGNIATVLR